MTTANYESIGVTECGKWTINLNEITGKKIYKPTDKDYYINKYHQNKKEITCDICGCVVMQKITEHKKRMKCRLFYYKQQEQLLLEQLNSQKDV